MPNDNIKRTMDKALRLRQQRQLREPSPTKATAPAAWPSSWRRMTDNRNRTAGPTCATYFDKYGGNLGATGCVSWSFDKKGVIVIDNEEDDWTRIPS